MRFWTKLGYGAGVALITCDSFLGGAYTAKAEPPSTISYKEDSFGCSAKKLTDLSDNYPKLAEDDPRYVLYQGLKILNHTASVHPVDDQHAALESIYLDSHLDPWSHMLVGHALECARNFYGNKEAAMLRLTEAIERLCTEDPPWRDHIEDLADAVMQIGVGETAKYEKLDPFPGRARLQKRVTRAVDSMRNRTQYQRGNTEVR